MGDADSKTRELAPIHYHQLKRQLHRHSEHRLVIQLDISARKTEGIIAMCTTELPVSAHVVQQAVAQIG